MKKIKLILQCLVLGLLSACTMVQERSVSVNDERRAFDLVDAGTIELRQGNLDAARANFELARELAGLPAAEDGLGCVSFAQGDYATAEKQFWLAYTMDEGYDHALANLALLYESQGKLATVESLFARALELDPENFRARNNFAAFLADYKKELPSGVARGELLKARAAYPHPVVDENLRNIEEL